MAMLKKKTRKAVRKSLKKAINKHGPIVVEHLVTLVAASIATYFGTEGKEGGKKLKKIAKKIPGGKQIVKAISSAIPNGSSGGDDDKDKREDRPKKPATA